MNRSVPRRVGWRIAAAIAAACALFLMPGVGASADDSPLNSFTTVGVPVFLPPVVGSTIAATTDGWSPTPDSFTYQWNLGGVPIDGQTDRLFVPTTDEMGRALTVTVTASLAGYTQTASTSQPVTVLGEITNSGASLSGTYAVGQVVTASPGVWSPADPNVTYLWRTRSGSTIASGSDATSITLTDADVGGVDLLIIATLAGYERDEVELQVPTFPPDRQLPGVVQIFGTAQHGHLLTASSDTESWNPFADVSTYQYQWNRNGQPIAGATSDTHIVAAADVGAQITATVTAGSDEFTPVAATSAPVVPTAGVVAFTAPTITGKPEIGEPLVANTSYSSSAGAELYGFEWFLNGTQIATDQNQTFYPTTPAEVGGVITAVAYGNTPAGMDWSDPSAPTAPIANGTIHPVGIELYQVQVAAPIQPNFTGLIDPNWIKYVIYRDGVPISYNLPYTPTTADWHHRISVVATETVPGVGAVVTTTKSYVVADGDFQGIPRYTGPVAVGVTESIDFSAIEPVPAHISVVWYYGTGSTADRIIGRGLTYKIPLRYLRRDIYAFYTITGTDMEPDQSWMGDSRVQYGTLPTFAAPSVAGPAEVGCTVTARSARIALASGESLSYQWYERASDTAPLIAIAHATSVSLTLSAPQLDELVVVRMSLRKPGYVTETVQSPPSAIVIALAGPRRLV